jgi:hypothetical protein
MVGPAVRERRVRIAVVAGFTKFDEHPGRVPIFQRKRASSTVPVRALLPVCPPRMIPGEVEHDGTPSSDGAACLPYVFDTERVGFPRASEPRLRIVLGREWWHACHHRQATGNRNRRAARNHHLILSYLHHYAFLSLPIAITIHGPTSFGAVRTPRQRWLGCRWGYATAA